MRVCFGKKDPGFHTMEFMEEKFEKKLDEMEKIISNKLKNELDTLRVSTAETRKSYANAIANDQGSVSTTKSIKICDKGYPS